MQFDEHTCFVDSRKYGFLFMVPVGMIGNCLSFLVMLQKQNRVVASNLYIAFLAVSDNFALLGKLIISVSQMYLGPWFLYVCKIVVFMSDGTFMISAYLVVCLTVDRFILVAYPFKVQNNIYADRLDQEL